MLKHEKLSNTNSTKSGVHKNFAKIQENEHIPEMSLQFVAKMEIMALYLHFKVALNIKHERDEAVEEIK